VRHFPFPAHKALWCLKKHLKTFGAIASQKFCQHFAFFFFSLSHASLELGKSFNAPHERSIFPPQEPFVIRRGLFYFYLAIRWRHRDDSLPLTLGGEEFAPSSSYKASLSGGSRSVIIIWVCDEHRKRYNRPKKHSRRE
jgi:hypothetical protein